MKYVANKILILFFLIFGFLPSKAQICALDSVYYVKMTPFIEKVLSIKDLSVNIHFSDNVRLIPTSGTMFAPNLQELIKDSSHVYLSIQQTGFFFELKEIKEGVATFIRADKTVNINYNIGCLYFRHHGQLYSYGGYGFWKTNGHIRKFNYIDKEWDIIATNKEVISDNFRWFSKKEGNLYIPFQTFVNAGLIDGMTKGKREDYASYKFNVDSRKWTKIGMLSSEMKSLFDNYNLDNGLFDMENGQFHLIDDIGYYFNFSENTVYRLKKVEVSQFLVRRRNIPSRFHYNGMIYNLKSTEFGYDSIPLSRSDFELLNFPIWGRDNSYDIYIAVAFVCVIIIIGAVLFFNRRVKRKIEQAQLKLLKTKSVNQAFVGTELALIKLLLTAANEDKKVDIFQINHVLGIKDKNIGLQKKVRSDMINAINEKYQFVTQNDAPLITSVRKEDDKRFFEYFIMANEIKSIQRFLEKT